MADETQQPSSQVQTADPGQISPSTKQETGQQEPVITPKDIEGKTPDEIIKFVAEKSTELGKTSKELEDYKKYYQQVQPFIDTITASQDLMKRLEEEHNKRLAPESTKTEATEPKKEEIKRDDTRIALEAQIISQFEQSKGISKLEGEQRKDLSIKIGQELMEMLDPGGTKNYNQIISEISLEKLPKFLDKAYNLATMDEKVKKVAETARSEAEIGATGVISSIPSAGGTADSVILTPTDRANAQKMGVSEEKWLERKKQIIERNEKEAGLR